LEIIPAIDLLGGKAVRLLRGRYDQATIYEADPAALAASWKAKVSRLHVVDLEGARSGRIAERELVRRIVAAFGSGVQVGGGLRTLDAITETLELGAERAVLGTAAVDDPELVERAASAHPGRIVVALDARAGRVATDGWEKTHSVTALELVASLGALPLAAVLYTDIDRDGTEVGPNVAQTARLAESTRFPVIASGGVGTLDHIVALARAPGPIAAAVVGRALHEARFTLDAAVAAAAG
jgi:phosphoribosylformimino-5-aminoimidazole carboxamide ribotide isomerase